jgi:hypothetical protein
MSRVQLAPNVDDIDAAAVFYTPLFHAEPAKRRPEYANCALDEPALTLALAQDGTTSCYPLQDKTWVTSPSGEPWEVYTVLADADAELDGKTRLDHDVDAGAGSGVGYCGTDPDTLTQAEQTASAGVCCTV